MSSKSAAQSNFSQTKSIAEQRRFLPVFGVREDLMDVIRENNVIVVVRRVSVCPPAFPPHSSACVRCVLRFRARLSLRCAALRCWKEEAFRRCRWSESLLVPSRPPLTRWLSNRTPAAQVGETGSGKTTQLTQYMMEEGYSNFGAEPRKQQEKHSPRPTPTRHDTAAQKPPPSR